MRSIKVNKLCKFICDATSIDEGYVHPETLLEKVKIKGRGGTILQPGIDMIESAKDLGARLPFIPRGEVFRMK
ncbi:hypothetical protein [Gottfriedia solisilvae]|uniref:Uncharacterized protein n=1 Tax=Gottfriedia solisilvae TaxID=1516104 RepID=A0A8J3EWY1_9BACI|nr:hypothetical protein [Gottfriedia solisilvae]GGI12547.1 hypothetical protein GCM10007380_13460 [Gottfriedia solisilvae]